MRGTVIFSSLLLFLSGPATANVFYTEASAGSYAAGHSSKEKPRFTTASADNTAADRTLQESGFSEPENATPIPVLLSISPTSGDRLQTLDVDFDGTSLQLPGETTTVNVGEGITINTLTVSLLKVTANLTITAAAATGPREFSVTTSGLLGGTSESKIFTVNNPAPTLENIEPKSGSRSETLEIVLTGTNFISEVSSVSLGTGITINSTTVNSTTQITANITIGSNAQTGARDVSVINAAPGGGTAALRNVFTVRSGGNNPAPTTTSISPSNKTVGEAGFTMTVIGTNFIPGSVVRFNGSNRTTTFVSSTQLNATIPASDLTTVGTFNITVLNPEPGGGTSAAQTFTVSPADNPIPTLISISPISKTVGDSGFTMAVTGTNFILGSLVRFHEIA